MYNVIPKKNTASKKFWPNFFFRKNIFEKKKIGNFFFSNKNNFRTKTTLTTFPLSFRPGLAPRAQSSLIIGRGLEWYGHNCMPWSVIFLIPCHYLNLWKLWITGLLKRLKPVKPPRFRPWRGYKGGGVNNKEYCWYDPSFEYTVCYFLSWCFEKPEISGISSQDTNYSEIFSLSGPFWKGLGIDFCSSPKQNVRSYLEFLASKTSLNQPRIYSRFWQKDGFVVAGYKIVQTFKPVLNGF